MNFLFFLFKNQPGCNSTVIIHWSAWVLSVIQSVHETLEHLKQNANLHCPAIVQEWIDGVLFQIRVDDTF